MRIERQLDFMDEHNEMLFGDVSLPRHVAGSHRRRSERDSARHA